MLNHDERNYLENQLIHSMMVFETLFQQVYNFNPNAEDAFTNEHNRNIYRVIVEYYVEEKYPEVPDVFGRLILRNASSETKKHFAQNVSTAEITNDFGVLLRLLEDSIENKTKSVVKTVDERKLVGLEYAESLREGIDRVILEKYECYRQDQRSNEQKVYDLLNTIQAVKEGKTDGDYIKTGFSKIDEAIIGIPKEHLSVIAARPSTGKTSFMLQLKRNLVEAGHKPLIISIEMTADQLMLKDLSAYSEIDSRDIESGRLTDAQTEKLHEAAKIICDENYWIEDSGTWTVEKIKATIRKYMIKQQVDCCFIDYLTLIKMNSRKERFDLVIGETTSALRELAKETKLPIVILSQLNREVEKRTDKRPQLSDLRESGSIEQDAKTVLFLYRPSNYGIDPFTASGNDLVTKENVPVKPEEYLEVIIGKARNGRTGIARLRYIPQHHKFESLLYKSTNQYSNAQYSSPNTNWYERIDGEENTI